MNVLKFICLIFLQATIHYSILLAGALSFPFFFGWYWKPLNFICPKGSICIIDDFRSIPEFFMLFFFPLITGEIVNFIVFQKLIKNLISKSSTGAKILI